MNQSWLIYTFFALFAYGFWGLMPKLSSQYLNPKSILLYESLGYVLTVLLFYAPMNFKAQVHPKGILFAMIAGAAGAIGTFFYLHAISKGKVSVVIMMTALYPLVALPLAYVLLGETLNVKQGIGMVFAVIALILFSL